MKDQLRFTQNFLHSKALVERIVKLGKIQPGSTVLEIGPGEGIITRELTKHAGKVIAVELDARLAAKARDKFSDVPTVEIIHADILQFDLATLGEYSVFSNVPFNITSELLEYLFHPMCGPSQAHLILQQDSIIDTNRQGFKTETFKSLLIKPLYEIDLAYTFLPSDFKPQPGVDTGLFAFYKRSQPLVDDYALYKDFIAFAAKDRVGEGVWRKVFSKNQLQRLTEQTELVHGRGLKSQSMAAIVAAFEFFQKGTKQAEVEGAMMKLREEQKRTTQINKTGDHHRSNKRRK